MFEAELIAIAVIAAVGALAALDGSRDVFHPLVFICPMMGFIYFWMPQKLLNTDALERFFDMSQLEFVQRVNILGVLAFVIACAAVGLRIKPPRHVRPLKMNSEQTKRLLIGATLLGLVGVACWGVTIMNVGGFVNAYSKSYSGGWDDNGYVRDGVLMLLASVLLVITAMAAGASRLLCWTMITVFGFPWVSQAVLMARRGPTFAFVVVVLMGWYTSVRRRPPLVAMAAVGFALGWLVLFMVTNRSQIYLGSSFEMKTDVSDMVEKPDTGNEYIYGSGTLLAAIKRDHYFWMRRYLAQVLVRPIPSAVWPTKYEDFGVPELLNNAGTGEGFADALGWQGAVGSAPGIVADLWVEFMWLCIPAMALLGWAYGTVWKKSVLLGGPWSSQYVLISALSIYLVMQTMEAVIFRTIELSVPTWLIWRWALKAKEPAARGLNNARRVLQRSYEHV